MSRSGHVPVDDEPLACDEFGHRLGHPDGVLVLRYLSRGRLRFTGQRQEFLHQLYWAPTGIVSATASGDPFPLGPAEAFWARRGVEHDVHAFDQDVVYRVCLREAPAALESLRAGPVRVDPASAELLVGLARRRDDVDGALADRARLLELLRRAEHADAVDVRSRGGRGYALAVSRALARDPADATDLAGWARQLHVSPKTLQRDVERCFGTTWSRWRTGVRLRAADVLLATEPVGVTARRVGYASPSAFVAAYAREYGRTPGQRFTNRP